MLFNIFRKINKIMYLLLIPTVTFSYKIEKRLLYEHYHYIEPKKYKLNCDFIEYKVVHRYFCIDSMPKNINKQLTSLLTEKAGEKWFNFINFLRADVLTDKIDSLSKKHIYILWFDFPVGKSDRYIFSITTNLDRDIPPLHFPNVIDNPYKKKILSIFEAWEKAEFAIKKRVELLTSRLRYNISRDEFEWHFQYREKTINIFKRRKSFFNICINAHTGEILSHTNFYGKKK